MTGRTTNEGGGRQRQGIPQNCNVLVCQVLFMIYSSVSLLVSV